MLGKTRIRGQVVDTLVRRPVAEIGQPGARAADLDVQARDADAGPDLVIGTSGGEDARMKPRTGSCRSG
jgi:hypothetical protein